MTRNTVYSFLVTFNVVEDPEDKLDSVLTCGITASTLIPSPGLSLVSLKVKEIKSKTCRVIEKPESAKSPELAES